MVIRIALPDLELANLPRLTARLDGIIDTASIWLEGSRSEVRVLAELESESALIGVIDAVQKWLTEAGAASAALSIGGRSYTLVGDGRTATQLEA